MWRALPVAGGTDALAAAAGLRGWPPGLAGPLRERAAAPRPVGRSRSAAAAARSPRLAAADGVVPLPLAPDVWRRMLGKDGTSRRSLAAAILEDRRASLLYRGLASLDEPTLEALAADPKVLRRIYGRHADTFAAFASAVRGARRRGGGAGGSRGGAARGRGSWARARRAPGALPREAARGRAGGAGRSSSTPSPASIPRGSASRSGRARRRGGRARRPCGRWPRSSTARGAWWRRRAAPSPGPTRTPRASCARCGSARTARSRRPRRGAFWHVGLRRTEAGGAGRRGRPRSARRRSADAAWLAEQVGDGRPGHAAPEARAAALRAAGLRATRPTRPSPTCWPPCRPCATRARPLLALERLGTRDPGLFAAAAWRRASRGLAVGAARRAAGAGRAAGGARR